MGAVLLAGADRHQEAGIALQDEADFVGHQRLQMTRRLHIVLAGCATAVAVAEWLHGNAGVWAWTAGAAALATAGLAVARGPRAIASGLAALASLLLGAVVIAGVRQVRRIECCWTEIRAERVPRDSAELRGALAAAVAEARHLAERGMTAALLPRDAAFEHLAVAMQAPGQAPGVEHGVVILGADGEPFVWAGRHRFVPARDTVELRAVITPFYVSLEARRQTQAGRTAVGSVLIDAAPAARDRDGAVSALFARRYGVTLRFYTPHLAPSDSTVFDYSTPDGRTLFSVQPIPPTQGDAKLAALHGAAGRAGAALAAALLFLFMVAPPGRWRWVVVLAAAWCLLRAPLGLALGLGNLFSPALFYRPMLGVFSASAGSRVVLGLVLLLAAALLWRRGIPRRGWTVSAAALLVLAAPYLVRYFGRGIAPPAGGVSVGLWISWQLAVAAAGMALVFWAAALVRGTAEPHSVSWTLPAACAWAVLAALAGLWLWQPYGAWPEWYTFVWLPALVGVLVPAPSRWAVCGIATVAGTAAALVTWGAAVEGRLGLAERDAAGLGRADDPPAVALLERMGHELPVPAPRTAGELYALWLKSPLAGEDYPASLAVWTRTGDPVAELRLARLDLPPPLVAALVRSPETRNGPRVERLPRVPGVHNVLVAPLPSGDVLTVGVGPRTLLIPADRVAQFLQGEVGAGLPYVPSLSLPSPGPPAESARVIWTRTGWSVRGERRVELPDGVRHLHLRVDLQPRALLVRGALVVVLDAVLLGAVWLASLLLVDGGRPRLPPVLAALRTSYRVRLTATLAGFFVVPVMAFALWSFAQLRDDARQDGDLLIRQTLRDAATTAGGAVSDRATNVERAIGELANRLDADLWLYQDGVLTATSTPVLDELGLTDPFLAPDVFVRLALRDELEVSADGTAAGRPVRVGYSVVLPGAAILAAPQLVDDERVRQPLEDLTLALVLATLVGLVAAVALAGLVARGLASPVAALRDAAVALGQSAPLPAFPPGALREFQPVMSAFERMAADVHKSQAALEEARHRTAQVLANVATGVIAVDEELRVTMANPRAADLLGTQLEPGNLLPRTASSEWLPVWNAVSEFLAAGTGAGREGERIAEREFDVGGRQIRVQIASLGPSPDGCVVALDDATAFTRAARVLAWGEMARQVAHEIKNPLTPIRLGVQHLQRARAEGRTRDFDATLQDTAARILAEIDRLDAIARAVSRFASSQAGTVPYEPVDLFAAAREVVQLYALGGTEAPTRFEMAGEEGTQALARRGEVKAG